MFAVGGILKRPYIYADWSEQNWANKIIAHATRTPFVEEGDRCYFTSGAKTPQGVKKNIQELERMGLDTYSSIRTFIRASIAAVKKNNT